MLYILHNLCLWFARRAHKSTYSQKSINNEKYAHFMGYFFITHNPKKNVIISSPYIESFVHKKNWDEKLFWGLNEISAFVSLNIVSKDEIGLLRIVDSFCVYYLQLSVLKLLFSFSYFCAINLRIQRHWKKLWKGVKSCNLCKTPHWSFCRYTFNCMLRSLMQTLLISSTSLRFYEICIK